MQDKKRLTGNFYFKQGFFGVTLMVEYYYTICHFSGDDSPDGTAWRKAKAEDLVFLKLKSEKSPHNCL